MLATAYYASRQPLTGVLARWENMHPIADTWGNWLRSFPWTMYAHLTFKTRHGEVAAMGMVRKLHHRMNRWTLGVHYYKRREGVRCFVAVEHTVEGAIHLHLLADEVDVRCMRKAADYWKRCGGNAEVKLYNPELPGTFYVSKLYRNDDAANVHLLGQWTKDTNVPA